MSKSRLGNLLSRGIATLFVLWPTTILAQGGPGGVPRFVPPGSSAPPNSGMAAKIGDALRATACAAGFCFGPDKKTKGFVEILGAYTNGILGFLGLIFLVLIIWHGFKWMTAAGNEEQVKKAQTGIRNTSIGLAIILLARMITFLFLEIIKPAIAP